MTQPEEFSLMITIRFDRPEGTSSINTIVKSYPNQFLADKAAESIGRQTAGFQAMFYVIKLY